MTLDSADIRFECRKCGQHLVVEAAGAGLTADCPICNTSVTVPRPRGAGRPERENSRETRGRAGLHSSAGFENSVTAYTDPAPDDLREELIDASLINGKLNRDLTTAREELARLQQQLKAATEECEHLNASSTHTQAELKTFQTERQQSKAELSALRQKWTSAEETLVAREAELKDLKSKLAGSVSAEDLKAAEKKLSEARRLAADWEAKAAAAHKAHDKAAKNVEQWKSKAAAVQAELVKLGSLREEESKATRVAADKARKSTAELERALKDERAQLAKVTGDRDAKQKALAELQARFSKVDEELHRSRGRLGELEATLTSVQETAGRLTKERAELQRLHDEARAQLVEAGDLKTQLARREEELRSQGEKLRLAEEAVETLTARCEQIRRESDTLRRDITDSNAGRELLEIRSSLDETTAERDSLASRLSSVETELRALTATEKAMRLEIEHARHDRDDALERVEALRESRAAKDNEVLRGIIARLNADLAQRTAEVLRMKRARYALKVAYIIFGIAFLAVVVFAIIVVPQALQQ